LSHGNNSFHTLEALQGITLEKDEWEKMSAVMPAAYRSLFTDVKK
jgi:hypothetical protein